METFTKLKSLVDNPNYREQRERALRSLDINTIDAPIVELIEAFATLPCCFTLQCCFGHFVYAGQVDRYNIEPLPHSDRIEIVEYRIAYVALCIENSEMGVSLFKALAQIPAIDPNTVQFGCADWFWQRQVNSYALQVAPQRYMTKDAFFLDYAEARTIERVKRGFFVHLFNLVRQIPPSPAICR